MYLLQKSLLLPLVVFPQLYLYAIHWFDESGLRLSISIDWLWGVCFPISTQFNALKKSLPCFVLLDRAWDVCFREDYSVLHVSTWFPDVSFSRDGLGIAFPGYLPFHCSAEQRASHCFLRSLALWKCASAFCLAIRWYWESRFRVSLPVFRPIRIRLPSCFPRRIASSMVFPNLSIGLFRFEILSPNVDSGRWSLDIVPPIFPLRSSSSKRVSAFPFR